MLKKKIYRWNIFYIMFHSVDSLEINDRIIMMKWKIKYRG